MKHQDAKEEKSELKVELPPMCLDWCDGHTQPWSLKCDWSTRKCAACSQCFTPRLNSSDRPAPFATAAPSAVPAPAARKRQTLEQDGRALLAQEASDVQGVV